MVASWLILRELHWLPYGSPNWTAVEARARALCQQRNRSGRCPPWNTPLGGAIGLHGGGTWRDWTLGCIALNDADIEILYLLLQIGYPVRIEP
jgi:hypothetical protein